MNNNTRHQRHQHHQRHQALAPKSKKYKPLHIYRARMDGGWLKVLPIRELSDGWLFFPVLKGGVKRIRIREREFSAIKEVGLNVDLVCHCLEEKIITAGEVFEVITNIKKEKLNLNRRMNEQMKSLFLSLGHIIRDEVDPGGDIDPFLQATKIAFNFKVMGAGANRVIQGLENLASDEIL